MMNRMFGDSLPDSFPPQDVKQTGANPSDSAAIFTGLNFFDMFYYFLSIVSMPEKGT